MSVPKDIIRRIIAHYKNTPTDIRAALALRLVAKTFAAAYSPKYLNKHLGADIGVKKNTALIRHNTIIHWPALREQHGIAESMRLIFRASNSNSDDKWLRSWHATDTPQHTEATIRILIHRNKLILLMNPLWVLETPMKHLIERLIERGLASLEQDEWAIRHRYDQLRYPYMRAGNRGIMPPLMTDLFCLPQLNWDALCCNTPRPTMDVPKDITLQIIANYRAIPADIRAALALRLVAKTFAAAYGPWYLHKHTRTAFGTAKYRGIMRLNTIINWSALRTQHGYHETMRLISYCSKHFGFTRMDVALGIRARNMHRNVIHVVAIYKHHGVLLQDPTLILDSERMSELVGKWVSELTAPGWHPISPPTPHRRWPPRPPQINYI